VKKFSMIAVAMTASLALGACSTEEEPEEPTAAEQTTEDTGDDTTATTGDMANETGDAAGATGDAAGATGDAASYSEPACQEFFTEGGPLADRAVEARAMIDNGEVTDTVAVSQVTLLKSRIDSAAETAPDDISALLLEVNAPFAEVVDTMNEGGEDVVDPESGEITLPEIDTQASEDAQAELETACAG
jgi:hypothetical protein